MGLSERLMSVSEFELERFHSAQDEGNPESAGAGPR